MPELLGGLTVGALLVVGGCGPLRAPCVPRSCADGLPVKVLQNVACPRGICGYTCAPNRWRVDDELTADR